MNPRFLIDGIVRQTTVLIAQLSTAAGIRAPLAHVADQVFMDLSREIESHGVGRKVAADMFGMALRTYQTKLQRLSESVSAHNRTLWEAVFDHITEAGAVSRADLMRRFRRDGERAVAAVLHDLVTSGLVYASGKGPVALYRATSETDRRALGDVADLEGLANLVWVHIYRNGAIDLPALEAQWPSARALLPEALSRLEREQRIARVQGPGSGEPGGAVGEQPACYRAAEILIPVGSELGWEGAVLDHFQAMAAAIANKLRLPAGRADLADQVGGATLTFDVCEGHPQERQVRALLARVRREANALWDQVKQTNSQASPPCGRPVRVTFYFGQNVEEEGDD